MNVISVNYYFPLLLVQNVFADPTIILQIVQIVCLFDCPNHSDTATLALPMIWGWIKIISLSNQWKIRMGECVQNTVWWHWCLNVINQSTLRSVEMQWSHCSCDSDAHKTSKYHWIKTTGVVYTDRGQSLCHQNNSTCKIVVWLHSHKPSAQIRLKTNN